MSKLEELIQELCPDGVEYKKLGKCADILIGEFVHKNKQSDDGKYPVYNGGTSNTGYYSESNRHGNRIIISARGANAGFINRVYEPFWSGNSCYTIELRNELLDWNFLYYWLKANENGIINQQQKGGIPAVSKKQIEELLIPVPPLEVQQEIVHILDSFTELTAELTGELTARKQQYEYYSLNIFEQIKRHAEMVSLISLGKWSGGKTPSMAHKEYWEDGTIPWISSKDMKYTVLKDTVDHISKKALNECSMTLFPQNIIAMVTRSGILKHTFPIAYVPFQTTINQDIKALIVREGISPMYVFYVLQAYAEDIRTKTKKQGGTVDSLDFQKILKYEVPIPTLDIQNQVIQKLDNFSALCNNLSTGIPAEINARQKQYEYYRDKLLTFKKLA